MDTSPKGSPKIGTPGVKSARKSPLKKFGGVASPSNINGAMNMSSEGSPKIGTPGVKSAPTSPSKKVGKEASPSISKGSPKKGTQNVKSALKSPSRRNSISKLTKVVNGSSSPVVHGNQVAGNNERSAESLPKNKKRARQRKQKNIQKSLGPENKSEAGSSSVSAKKNVKGDENKGKLEGKLSRVIQIKQKKMKAAGIRESKNGSHLPVSTQPKSLQSKSVSDGQGRKENKEVQQGQLNKADLMKKKALLRKERRQKKKQARRMPQQPPSRGIIIKQEKN